MKKIIQHLKSEWYKYLLEILVIVIGIMVAFSLNNWKERVSQKKVEQQLYSDLLQELSMDLDEIIGNREYNQYYLSRYKRASNIIITDSERAFVDTLGIISTELTNFSDFEKNDSQYEVLASSGKLDLFTNKDILARLQHLSVLYTYINRLEKNHEQLMFLVVPKISEYIQLKPFSVKSPESLYDYRFHNDLEYFIKIGQEKEGLYQQAELDLTDLITSLEKVIEVSQTAN